MSAAVVALISICRVSAIVRGDFARRGPALDASFPFATPAAHMLVGRLEREYEVGGGNCRQRNAPPWRDAIEAQYRLKSQRHQRPPHAPEQLYHAAAAQSEYR